MSKKTLLKNHLNFENKIHDIIKYGLDIINDELLHKSRKMTKNEKQIFLEALLLRSCALWENFLEDEVVYLIILEPETFKKYLGLTPKTRLNIKLVRAILYADKYQDYHGLEQWQGYFNKILDKSYNPFQKIPKERIQKIIFTYKIRNYLSHYSDFSKKKLFDAYKKDYSYQKFLEPGVFLLKQRGINFEKLIHNFSLVSVSMKNSLGVK